MVIVRQLDLKSSPFRETRKQGFRFYPVFRGASGLVWAQLRTDIGSGFNDSVLHWSPSFRLWFLREVLFQSRLSLSRARLWTSFTLMKNPKPRKFLLLLNFPQLVLKWMPDFTIHTNPDNRMEHKNEKHIPIKEFLCVQKVFALFISCNFGGTQKVTNTGLNPLVSAFSSILEAKAAVWLHWKTIRKVRQQERQKKKLIEGKEAFKAARI